MAYFRSPLSRADTLPNGYSRAPQMRIDHSGNSYNTCIRGPHGNRVWPVEELFARRKFKATVKDRIARLNPYGHEEGQNIKGYHPKDAVPVVVFDAVSQRDYIKRWGTKAGAEVVYKRGRHKYVSRMDYVEGPN